MFAKHKILASAKKPGTKKLNHQFSNAGEDSHEYKRKLQISLGILKLILRKMLNHIQTLKLYLQTPRLAYLN